jgi:uncharacterized damage-inducible protein DinB
MTLPDEKNPLVWLFAHNAWATDRLLDFCGGLSEEQLAATAPGAVDSVLGTLQHYVQAEGGYYTRLALDARPAHWDLYLAKDFDAVRERAAEMKELWAAYAATDPDPSATRGWTWPDVRHEFPAGMETAQALSHSHAHREQVCVILTSIGLQPPDISALAWGDSTGWLRRLPVG